MHTRHDISLAACLLLCCALSAWATPSLSVVVKSPKAIHISNSLFVTTVLKNTGFQTTTLLKDPRGIFSSYQTDVFRFRGDKGSPKFEGAVVQYSPNDFPARNNSYGFVKLGPGESLELTHDITGVYNFTDVGAGLFELTAANTFYYTDAAGKLATVDATAPISRVHISYPAVPAKPSQNSALRRNLRKTIAYSGCSSARQSIIQTAATSSNTYVSESLSYLATMPTNSTRFRTWFGVYTSSRFNTVQSVYSNIGTDATSTTYDCTCTDSNTISYVYPSSPGFIYLCGAFWGLPNTSFGSRAGSILAEQARFNINGGATDYVLLGQAAAKALATSNPSKAINNAINYEYFAEDDFTSLNK